MIDQSKPDYLDTPASDLRPDYGYQPREHTAPLVSIITPFYNTSPKLLRETCASIQRMSFVYWEWLVVDDGSTDAAALGELERLRAAEPRLRVIHQENSGPGHARNRAAREARGKYLLQLDSDDLVEPTFLEKAIWVLETQPQFAAIGSYNVTFGTQELLWTHGFHDYDATLDLENMMTSQNVVRRDAFLEAGGYDETLRRGHEDWDFWLNLADSGYWGHTIPEFLTWYRNAPNSRREETRGDGEKVFHQWLQQKHLGLKEHFPRPAWKPSLEQPHATVSHEIPVRNPLDKPKDTSRILFVVPWLVTGGADKFNLDLVKTLSARGDAFTIVTTMPADNSWLPEFAHITPDIFCLNKFLAYADYPRFLDYLVESRQIDTVLITQSELGFALAPYLRVRHPNVALLSYSHVEEEHWNNGGYPAMSARLGAVIDQHVTSTNHLKRWMVTRGADAASIAVCHTNIDAQDWDPARYDAPAIRARYNIPLDKPVILFVGRLVDQKRPLVFAEIVKELARRGVEFTAVVVGEGELSGAMKQYIQKYRLDPHVRFLGNQPNSAVRGLQAAADIFLLPSKYEGLALVLFECMAMKTVPVATDFGGHPELVTPECGYLIGASDDEVTAYADAVFNLINDPDRRTRMAEAGRTRVSEQFSLDHMATGMHEAMVTARQTAVQRPSSVSAVDTAMSRVTAHGAIELFRLQRLADHLWWSANQNAPTKVDIIRQIRQWLLPIGTQRYDVYASWRHGLRSLLGHARASLSPGRAPGAPHHALPQVDSRQTLAALAEDGDGEVETQGSSSLDVGQTTAETISKDVMHDTKTADVAKAPRLVTHQQLE